MNNEKITEQQMLENIQNECIRRGGNIEFNGLVEYKNTKKTYLKLKCLIDGYEWQSTNYYRFMNGMSCPKCSGLKISEEQMIENVQKESKRRNNVEFLGLVEYKDANTTYLKLRCLIDGNEWQTLYNSFMRGSGCPKCGRYKVNKITEQQMIENVKKECEIRGNVKFIGLVEYINSAKTYIKLESLISGKVRQVIYRNFVSKKKRK